MKTPALLARLLIAAVLSLLVSAPASRAQSTVDPANAFAWSGNVGGLNWRPTAADGALTGEYVCSGMVWAPNAGWINLGHGTPANGIRYQNTNGADSGVNLLANGSLRGLAWGANIGWVNFEATGNPRIDFATGILRGYAWSANAGWLTLDDGGSHFVATTLIVPGADTDADSITDAWELEHAGNLTTFTINGDADGDGIPDVAEYATDTLTGGALQLICSRSAIFAALRMANQPCRATTIFDNTSGSANGFLGATTNTWLANEFCPGAQAYRLDAVSLLLSTQDGVAAHISTVRLQIYSNDRLSNKPLASAGLTMNLSGRTNPITLPAGAPQSLVTWTPATPFTLSPNTCYWAVLSVDSGDLVYETASFSMPTGDAGVLGLTSSSDAGASWAAAGTILNCKMVIEGTAIPAAEGLVDSSSPIPGGTGNFTSLPGGPSFSGGTVAFFGIGVGNQQGIYAAQKGPPPIRFVDTSTPIPGGSGNFTGFSAEAGLPTAPSLSGDNVVFYATGSGGQKGIYVAANGPPPVKIADASTPIPNGSGNFTAFTRPGAAPSPVMAGENGVPGTLAHKRRMCDLRNDPS